MSVFDLSTINSPLMDSLNGESHIVQMRATEKIIEQIINPNSSSSSSCEFVIQAPGHKAILDTNIIFQADLSVTYYKSGGVTLTQDTPRAYPLNSIIQQCSISVNSQILDSEPYKLVPFITRMDKTADNSRYDDLMAQQLDRCANPILELLFVQDNAFLDSASTLSNMPTRKDTVKDYKRVTSGDSKIISFTSQESLLHGLLNRNLTQSKGISNLSTMKINLNFVNSTLMQRVLMLNTATDATTVTAAISNPRLILRYEIPSVSIPDIITLPTSKFNFYNTNGSGSLSVGSSTSIVSNSVRLSQIPDLIYVFAMKPYNSKDQFDGDGFLVIDNLSVQAGSLVNVFANAQAAQLYQMSVQNGLKMSFREFVDYVGSIVVIDPSKDIGGIVSGSKSELLLTVTASVRNTHYATFETRDGTARVTTGGKTFTPDLIICCVESQRLEISPTSANLFSGVTLDETIENMQNGKELNFSDVAIKNSGSISGGSFMDFIKDTGKGLAKAYGFAKQANNQFINPGLNTLSQLAPGNKYLMAATQASNQARNITGEGYLKGGSMLKGGCGSCKMLK
jgi:hypothetical protein